MKKIICILSLLAIVTLSILLQNDALVFIHGTNADGTNNLAISIGNDDCYATAQSGDYTGVSISCWNNNLIAYYVSNPIQPFLPGYSPAPEIY